MIDPPRRYSVGQPGFDPEIAQRLLIKLDSKKLDLVIEYDADAGTALVFRAGTDGQIVLEGDETATDALTGEVTVEWR